MRSKKNILLAEEDRMAASLIAFRLRKGGYHVDQYDNDAEVKEYLKTKHPDLIICSLSIGGTKGANLIKYLKEEKVFSNIPLIIITSSQKRASLLKNSDLNIKYHLMKPVQTEHLVDVVTSFLNKETKIL
ncbi:response regulator [Galbibacter sp. EGI 63066]|uniref:response regulator n=1 Tax=Galbibacter sp. EGI 63066 TaxID=2993559 RepID=UPI002248F716|nr:response regulator [Galbibacter sp. EGI 63066]MCX2681377.1 response regulator [Galbibacter sp. EGI 63066]